MAGTHGSLTLRGPGLGIMSSPDILIAMDVDAVELMLQVLILHVGHVIDHFQHDEPGKHRQHKPLLGEARRAGSLGWPVSPTWLGVEV